MTSGVTRMGAVAYAKSLADEVGRDNVLVNNVAPGFLMTERMRHIFETRSEDTGQDLESVLEAGPPAFLWAGSGAPKNWATSWPTSAPTKTPTSPARPSWLTAES